MLKSYVKIVQMSRFLRFRTKFQFFLIFLKKILANKGFFDEHCVFVGFVYFREQNSYNLGYVVDNIRCFM